MSAFPRVLTVLLLLLGAVSCGAGTRSEAEAGAPSGPGGVDPAGPPVVVGTTLEAATGRPVAARLEAPDGTRGRSGEDGRFSLRLPPGTAGPLVAETEEGLVGRVVLRPLQGGRLEVVVHLRPAETP